MSCCNCSPKLNHVERTQQQIKDLQQLLDAKSLLDEILQYVDEDKMEFRGFVEDKVWQRQLNRVIAENRGRMVRDKDQLRQRIDAYKLTKCREDAY